MAHPKGVLLERAAKLGFERPQFRTERTGPEHEPIFIADVIVDGEVLGTGQGGSKRTAETRAAEEALAQLDAADESSSGRGRSKGKRRGAASGQAGAADSGTEAADARQGATQQDENRQDENRQDETQEDETQEDEMASEEFDGPWPMFDDLLAAVLAVAERRVAADLRGDEAREAIRDFSLTLYKELLGDLGEVVEDDESDDDEEDD